NWRWLGRKIFVWQNWLLPQCWRYLFLAAGFGMESEPWDSNRHIQTRRTQLLLQEPLLSLPLSLPPSLPAQHSQQRIRRLPGCWNRLAGFSVKRSSQSPRKLQRSSWRDPPITVRVSGYNARLSRVSRESKRG